MKLLLTNLRKGSSVCEALSQVAKIIVIEDLNEKLSQLYKGEGVKCCQTLERWRYPCFCLTPTNFTGINFKPGETEIPPHKRNK